MGNPRETGISSITGKVLIIRHANESERIDISDILKKRSGGSLDLSGADVVVASQEASLLGFAVLTHDEGRGGCLSLSEGKLHRGIGRVMLDHLLDYSAVKRVFADRVAARHLLTMGFKRESASERKEAGMRNTREGRGRGSSLIFVRASS
jgi:hypothetical protein